MGEGAADRRLSSVEILPASSSSKSEVRMRVDVKVNGVS